MAGFTSGSYLNEYVAPQLLLEFKNDKADFLGVLKAPNAAALTADGIKFNKLINNVGFFVDNTADFTAKAMTGTKGFVPWEKYDTEPTSVTDAEVRALSYDKRSEVRNEHKKSFSRGIRDHVVWKLAPDDATSADMPVVRTTGVTVGTRKRLSFADLVTYLEKIKMLNLPDMNELYIILCPEHVTDLILDRDSANLFANRDIYFDTKTGKVNSVMGFKFFENNAILAYTTAGVKKAKGAAMIATDRYASLFFYAANTVYWVDSLKILYSPETTDTKSADPTSIFRTQAYGMVDRIQEYGVGAIVSAVV